MKQYILHSVLATLLSISTWLLLSNIQGKKLLKMTVMMGSNKLNNNVTKDGEPENKLQTR